ncbi:MAG: type II toxin-antitoxin system RelE/ParE family toxin [Acidimicrobiia bacterium]
MDLIRPLHVARARQRYGASARRKLDQINRARDLRDLAIPPGNRLERLKGDRRAQHSIRINEQYRVCFRWEAGDAHDVEITDYH